MKCSLKEYLDRVFEQLVCNSDEEYKSKYVTYNYTNDQINENLDYFQKCLDFGLSPYKSLLFFSDYLEGKPTCIDKKQSYNFVVEGK